MGAPDAGFSRRSLLNWLLAGSGSTLIGVLLYPVLRFIAPPVQAEASAGAVVVGNVKEFPPNTGKVVRFGTRPAIVVHLPTGEFRAFSAVCTHLQCTVQYRPDLAAVWCACHNGRFDLTGRNVGGPPPRPLESLEVLVHGDDVVVSRRG
jgi:cytochrome b6-f complex iron-sulfur subunit